MCAHTLSRLSRKKSKRDIKLLRANSYSGHIVSRFPLSSQRPPTDSRSRPFNFIIVQLSSSFSLSCFLDL